MNNWKEKLKLEGDEFVTSYFSKFFSAEILIRFKGTGDKVYPKQSALVSELIKDESKWLNDAVNGILDYYQEVYLDYRDALASWGTDEETIEEILPMEIDAEKLLTLITPVEIYINPEEECAPGRFGLGFECEWESEHGLGVSFNEWDVNEVGVMEVAFAS